ncbi:DNA alkylation repair protein [Leptospira gomenensis]|uniref:DNA alkylation repair protein n=1 Tax=Leptospira gomenensis TaxID=2484974 RepID=A0A5F1Y7I5_9LEPT|nr:DNA alkylation repair protein [Leptospira gomenensis]TGK29103.1 DNA alkylation repair protein [Leptospira gomenensis]TGK45030.1 DNA alkylation repair protein [Leptospira gomenensis]TGK51902.1 DNA alkylation repair protein [Leptospira gomenensis]TGK67356.1 DNA alkylation repair protein [Leptospira gomenensis]
MNADQVMKELERMSSPEIKKIFLNHGTKEPFFGVRVGDLKKIQKKVKKDNQLALELYKTGNADAMYLAGLIADETKIRKQDLQNWVKRSVSPMTSEYTVPWIAAETPHGWDLAREWIESPKENVASSGWNLYSSLLSIRSDEEIDAKEIHKLLKRVESEIGSAHNRVRYCMNGFVIAVGIFYPKLLKESLETAKKIGKVEVWMGKTSCQVPDATSYIRKAEAAGKLGKKKKAARC